MKQEANEVVSSPSKIACLSTAENDRRWQLLLERAGTSGKRLTSILASSQLQHTEFDIIASSQHASL